MKIQCSKCNSTDYIIHVDKDNPMFYCKECNHSEVYTGTPFVEYIPDTNTPIIDKRSDWMNDRLEAARVRYYEAYIEFLKLELDEVRIENHRLTDELGELDEIRCEYGPSTGVQRVAIETIMNVHEVSFEELLEISGVDIPKTPEPKYLTYNDAVKVVQHGNIMCITAAR